MAYTQQQWHDLPATDTPIDAAQLTHMEEGIFAAAAAADAAVAAVNSFIATVTAQLAQLQLDLANTPIIWNTRVGGLLTGAITTDATGAYPPHPVTTREVIFNNPLVQPTFDGQATGGGGMVPIVDIWYAGGNGVSAI